MNDGWRRRLGRWALRSRCTLGGSGGKMLDTPCIEFEKTTNHVGIEERGKQDIERQSRCGFIVRALTSGSDLDYTLNDRPRVLKLFEDFLGRFALPFSCQEIKSNQIDLLTAFPCPL